MDAKKEEAIKRERSDNELAASEAGNLAVLLSVALPVLYYLFFKS